jgi:hypothetical protein
MPEKGRKDATQTPSAKHKFTIRSRDDSLQWPVHQWLERLTQLE